MTAKTTYLRDILDHEGDALAQATSRFGRPAVDAAIHHLVKRDLRCDVSAGTASDADGQVKRFVGWTEEDAASCVGNPQAVLCDFFRPEIANMAERIVNGYEPAIARKLAA